MYSHEHSKEVEIYSDYNNTIVTIISSNNIYINSLSHLYTRIMRYVSYIYSYRTILKCDIGPTSITGLS